MILTFSKPEFVSKIETGIKKHTIRKDEHDRWHAGRMIHLWFGSPRNPSKKPFLITLKQCISTQKIKIEYQGLEQNGSVIPAIKIDGHYIGYYPKLEIAINDGFDTIEEFFQWFDKDFEGKIIHWTNLRYF